MARQEQLIAQTIANMKRAMLRKDDDSESDDSIKKPTNSGNKLKRKAKFVHEGRLDQANDIRASRRRINYNGYFREVISRNPMRMDHDGDVVDNDDDDSTLELEDSQEDPYAEIHIETLLRPLTSAADLKTHPTLSIPYTSKVLDEMLYHAQDMVFREEDALWKIKTITGEFHGDSCWMPTGIFETDNDLALLGPVTASTSTAPSDAGEADRVQPGMSRWTSASAAHSASATDDISMELDTAYTDRSEETSTSLGGQSHDAYEAPVPKTQPDVEAHVQTNGLAVSGNLDHGQAEPQFSTQHADNGLVNGEEIATAEEEAAQVHKLKQIDSTSSAATTQETAADPDETGSNEVSQSKALTSTPAVNGEVQAEKTAEDVNNHQATDAEVANNNSNPEEADHENNDEEDDDDDDNTHAPHRMTTRAKAQAATSTPNSPHQPSSPANNAAPFIHPLFIPPRTAITSREFGIPADEADETRRLLCAYVQKQEEVCRSANRIWEGLLKAKRLRDDVLEWCQAEGHIGEMSDGEDWYDRDKWGLEYDLKKGEELDEEDTNATGKKTRHRRTARDA